MKKIMVGNDRYIDLDERRVGTAKVKMVKKPGGNYAPGAESFLRVYFDTHGIQKEEPLALVSGGNVLGIRGPLNTVLPYQDGGIPCSNEDEDENDFVKAMNIARHATIPDGKYDLYLVHQST